MASQCFRGWGRRRRGGLTGGRDWHLNRVISFKRKRENGIRLDKQSKYNDVEAVCDFYQSVENSNITAVFFFSHGNFMWHLLDMRQSSFSLCETQFWGYNNDSRFLSLLYLL